MPVTVVYDANVLYPNTLRDLLIRVLDLIDLGLKIVWACVQQIADSRVNPPQDVDEVLSQLERSGLIKAASALRVR